MPEMLAVHYSPNGVPNRVVAKSVATAFSLVFVQIGVTALLVGIAAAIFFCAVDNPRHSAIARGWCSWPPSMAVAPEDARVMPVPGSITDPFRTGMINLARGVLNGGK
jgi:hypothetical protein